MSMERLKVLYKMLNGEPTPDEEEEAQKELVGIFEDLKNGTDNQENKEIIAETLDIVKNWDTLDQWFSEVPQLSENIKKVLEISGSVLSILQKKDLEEVSEDKDSQQVLSDEMNRKLSDAIASAISQTTQNLPPGADIALIISNVTKSVTESFMKQNNLMLDQEEQKIAPKDKEVSEPKIKRPKLQAPTIEIPKVVKPKKKIVPPEVSFASDKSASLQTEPIKINKSLEIEKPKEESNDSNAKSSGIVRLPQPRKISIPQPQTINVAPKPERTVSENQPISPQRIVVKPISISGNGESPRPMQPIAIKPVNVQGPQVKPISQVKPAQPIEPIQPVKPIGNGGQPVIKPVNIQTTQSGAKPKISVQVQPVRSQNAPAIQPVNANIPVIKPVNIPVNNTKDNLYQNFNQPAEPMKPQKIKVGGITGVNISGGDFDGFGGAAKVSQNIPKDDFDFIASSDPYEKMSKDQLYQELIAMEGKKYAIERTRKDMRSKHEKGMIGDVEYKTAIERYKYDLEHISQKINDLRRRLERL